MGDGMELVVVKNQLLQGYLGGLCHSSFSSSQFLLHSLSLDITSQLLNHIAGLAQGLCSASSFSPAVSPYTLPSPAAASSPSLVPEQVPGLPSATYRGRRWSSARPALSPAGKRKSLPYLELHVPVEEDPALHFVPPQLAVQGPGGARPLCRPICT